MWAHAVGANVPRDVGNGGKDSCAGDLCVVAVGGNDVGDGAVRAAAVACGVVLPPVIVTPRLTAAATVAAPSNALLPRRRRIRRLPRLRSVGASSRVALLLAREASSESWVLSVSGMGGCLPVGAG